MNEDEISETLNRVVPSRDVPEGVLAGARRRRRRTRVAAGGAAVALVTALTVSLGLTMGNSNQQVVATPAPSPSTNAASAQLEPEACRDAAVTTLPDNQLPDGAIRVWLCGGPSDSFGGIHYVGAPEPLTSNVADAVAAFNAVPSAVGAMSCTPNNSIGYTVVYEYPDGGVHTVEGSLGGCEAVLSSGTHRGDARGYLEALRGLWNDQRITLGTVFDADVQVCSSRTSVMGVGIADMTRAYACGPIEGRDPAKDSVQIPLSDELVADIVKEIGPRDGMVGLLPGVTMAAPSLVFLSAEGDPLTILGTPEGYRWYDPEPTGMNQWVPSAGLAARIYDEMTRDSTCAAPPRIVPADVKVDVYDAGGGAASAELVAEHLAEAGFDVTNTGESAFQSLGSAIITRAAPGNAAMDLVGSQFTDAGGEMSREDDVVDVLVTTMFDEENPPFAAEPAKDVPNGSITCSPPQIDPLPSVMSTPSNPTSPSQPSTSGEPGVNGECDLDADGRMATTELPENTLPDGPEAVWLCSTMRAPFEPLVGSEATRDLVDSFKKLSTTPPTDQRSSTVPSYLVAVYPDGQRYVVHVDRESSFEVTWGSAGQQVRYGGREWVLGLEELWVNQRNENPLRPPAAPRAGICDNMHRSLGRTIEHYDEDGALCVVVRSDEDEPVGMEVQTPQQLLADVMEGVQEDGFPWPASNESPLKGWQGDSILLVDDYGDRQPLLRGADDTYFWVDGAETLAWKPPPALQARLAQAFDDGRPSPQPTNS
ncbi:MAG: LytR C-terminal domain-containing protein [Propionibacteriaceae bacterium]|nr:LytR C-terminal domain-containing protein [Propionibacteriaceae bacterium]